VPHVDTDVEFFFDETEFAQVDVCESVLK